MNSQKILVFLILSMVYGTMSGQKITPSPEDLYADASEFMLSGDYNDALPILLNLDEQGYKTANMSYRIGECYLNIPGKKTKAIPYLKDAVSNISTKYSGKDLSETSAPAKAMLYLGIAYRLNYDFDNAIKTFNGYLNTLDDTDKDNRRLVEYHIERCLHARELMDAPAVFSLTSLNDVINAVSANFNPLVTSNEKEMYYMKQLKFYDAIMHAVKSDTLWKTENLIPAINSDGDHYLTGMSADGNQLYLTAFDFQRNGEIFTTSYQNEEWSKLKKLSNHINTIFNETHASLSPDGKTLYFTSDRKGGYGGLDIYKSALNDSGNWSQPVNLGPLINTPYNEETPFLSSDGRRLFFSSQGHYNMGGYDVFYSGMDDDGNWLPPVNIGYPLNTTDDDLFFFPLGNGTLAYQSRFSSTTANTDIMRIVIKSFGNPARFTVNGKIGLKADPDFNPASISVAFIDQNKKDTLAVKPLNEDGSFNQRLTSGIYELDFYEGRQSILTKQVSIPDYFPYDDLIIQDSIIVASKIKIPEDTLYLKDIRFAFNKAKLGDPCQVSLDELAGILVRYPEITIIINGYTDALGSAEYNVKLSRLRANKVADYLKKKANLAGRIEINACGETNPVAINENADGTDNPDGRSFNRRTEVVLKNIPPELLIIKVHDIPAKLVLE